MTGFLCITKVPAIKAKAANWFAVKVIASKARQCCVENHPGIQN